MLCVGFRPSMNDDGAVRRGRSPSQSCWHRCWELRVHPPRPAESRMRHTQISEQHRAPSRTTLMGTTNLTFWPVTATSDLWLYPGNGSAGWMPRVLAAGGWNNQTNSLGIGDFQGDGFVDVAVSNRGGMWIERGNGQGGWLALTWAGYGWFFGSEAIGVGDFNSDGTSDVVGRDNSGVLWLYPGDGTGGWLPQRVTGAGWNAMNPPC